MRRALRGYLPPWQDNHEEVLRTYMLNGTDPEELEAESCRVRAEKKAKREALAG